MVPPQARRPGPAWWALETGFLDATVSSLPSPAARLAANVQATGAGGGHDLHYRTLRKMGVTLLGHFLGADGRRARFAPDLGESVAWGDERNAQLMDRSGSWSPNAACRGRRSPSRSRSTAKRRRR